MNKKTRGFTLVELLIVIVVIAILAAITLVSYNGVQRRAHNTVTLSAAKNALNVLTSYYTLNGQIFLSDLPPGFHGVCIGTIDSYPESSNLDAGECYPNFYASAQLEAGLNSIGTLNLKPYEFDAGDDNYTRGIQYSFDGDAYMWYDLVGADQDCELSGATSPGGGPNETDCRINMTEFLGEAPIDYSY